MFRRYEELCRQGHMKVGRLWLYGPDKGSGEPWVLNFPTKTHWRYRYDPKAKDDLIDPLKSGFLEWDVQQLAELTGIDARRVDTIRRALQRADVRSFSQLACNEGHRREDPRQGAGVGTPTGSHPSGVGVMRLYAAMIAGSLGLSACAGDRDPSLPPATGPELLEAAIAYHDPEGNWPRMRHTLVVDQSRPVKGTDGGDCFALIGGQAPTEDQVAAHRLDCPAIERMRNYYLYLWGLPMKLRDPGTHIDPVIGDEDFDGQPSRVAKVTYDPAVGSDTWYFHFEPGTYRMIGYRFYHDEAAGDGEYILLTGEREVRGMRIPAERRWFTNTDDRYLGTDILVDDFTGPPGN